MITSPRILAGEPVRYPISNCCVKNATAVNQTVAIVKYTTGEWAPIVVKPLQQKSPSPLRNNVQEQQRRGQDVKTRQPVPVAAVTCTDIV